MKILMFDRVPEAVAWAQQRILGSTQPVGDVTAVSLVDDNDEFMAVTVYSAYTGQNLDMHIAVRPGAHWGRSYFKAAFYLPFEVIGVPRITGLIRSNNWRAERFVGRLGFQYEGRMRKAFEDGSDLLLYGFLLEEYQRHPWSRHEIDRRTIQFGPGSPRQGSLHPDGGRGETAGAAPVA